MNDEIANSSRINKIMVRDVKDQLSLVELELEVECHKQFNQPHEKHQKVLKLVTKYKCARKQQIHINLDIKCIVLKCKICV